MTVRKIVIRELFMDWHEDKDIADMLRHMADEIENGVLKGHYPNYELINASGSEKRKASCIIIE